MSISEQLQEKINSAYNILKEHYESDYPFCVKFSGGKDSCVLKHLVQHSGYPFETHYTSSTFESDINLEFLDKYHKDVIWHVPEKTNLQLIREKGYLPLFINSFTQREIFQRTDDAVTKKMKLVVYGDRRAEIKMRSRANLPSWKDMGNGRKRIYPLYDWTNEDIEEYIAHYDIPMLATYEMYGYSYNEAICNEQWPDIREVAAKIHTRNAKEYQDICEELFDINPILKNSYPNPKAYWDWWLIQDQREDVESWDVYDERVKTSGSRINDRGRFMTVRTMFLPDNIIYDMNKLTKTH